MKKILQEGVPPIPGNPSAEGVFTTDGRPCITMCDSTPREKTVAPAPVVKPKIVEGDQPVEVEEDQSTTEEEKVEEKEKPVKEEKSLCIKAGSNEATCNMTLKDPQLSFMKTGDRVRMCCPAGCKALEEAVV